MLVSNLDTRNFMRFDILTTVTMKSTIFWAVMPCGLVEIYRCFEERSTSVLRVEK
jgi:hypothetical protein